MEDMRRFFLTEFLFLPKRERMKKNHPQKGKDETRNTFYHGRILVYQKKRGYRFSVDAPLLADFIQTEKKDVCIELGTGSGIISLLLSSKPFLHITAVEIQGSLAELAQRNVQLNRLQKRIRVVHADFLDFRPPQNFDVVCSNPPYIKTQAGRLSSTPEKSIAKHEVKCDILGVMQKTAALLKKNGRAYFVFTAKREPEFVHAAEKAGLRVKTKRLVYPKKGARPNFLLSQCVFSRAGMDEQILPPLFLFEGEGEYTPEAKEIFTGRTHVPFF
jgi:tRNA1Val (adenine37-N6)-methyltransferase